MSDPSDPSDPSDSPITARSPARPPDRLPSYSRPTPIGVQVSILLAETGFGQALDAFVTPPAVARGLGIPAAVASPAH